MSVPPLPVTVNTPFATEAVQSVTSWPFRKPRPKLAFPFAPPRSLANAGVKVATDCVPARAESEESAEGGIVNVSSERSVNAPVPSRSPQVRWLRTAPLFTMIAELASTLATFPANVWNVRMFPLKSSKVILCVETGPGGVRPSMLVWFGDTPTSGCLNVNPPP